MDEFKQLIRKFNRKVGISRRDKPNATFQGPGEDLQLFHRMKAIEQEFLQPHDFTQFKNYWLPVDVVKDSRNVLSFGVHRDVGFEQAMCDVNPGLNIHCYDPTPATVKMFSEQDFPHKDKITYHNKAYASFHGSREENKMKFYYDQDQPERCYSLYPLPCFKNLAFTEVSTTNLEQCLYDVGGDADIIKADIEGVWFDFCREILDLKISFKAFVIEFEMIDAEQSPRQFKDLLSEFSSRGYKLYLNRSRNKCLSEAIILPS